MATLQEHLEQRYSPAEGERFVIDDDDKATWALRKLAALRAQMQGDEVLAAAEMERVQTWIDGQREAHAQAAAFFEGMLAEYHASILEADPKRKTVRLPAGTLRARKRPDGVQIDDPDAFVERYLPSRPDLIRTSHAPDKAAIKTAVLKDGEILALVEKIEGGIAFSVEVTP